VSTLVADNWLVREGKRKLRSVSPQFLRNWREALYYLKYGEVELHLVEFLCRPGQDAIDVGAHDGCYVHLMKLYARQVYAFEPLPWLANDLRQKFSRGVAVSELALSNATGSAVLRLPLLDGNPVPGCASISALPEQFQQCREIQVKMDMLDNVYTGNAGMIKIDVEGHEEGVLEGARATIARSQPRLVVEIDERLSPGGVRRVADFLATFDYRGFFIFRREVVPCERFDRAVLQRPEDLPNLRTSLDKRERFGRYIYNFLFFPATEPQTTFRKIKDRLEQL
jgi:FkbM family methyltransferase